MSDNRCVIVIQPGLFNRIRNDTQKNKESAIYGRKA